MNTEEIKREIELLKKVRKEKRNDLKQDMLMKLASRRRSEAVDEFVSLIKRKNKIFTIRSDLKTEIWIYQDGIVIPEGRTYIKEFIRSTLEEAYTSALANEVLSKIEVDTYINETDFFKQPNTEEIAVLNGILNLKTRELKPFDREKVFFTKINAQYIQSLDCPKIKSFLKDTLKNEEDYKIIQELIGFVLYPEYFIPKAFMFLGEGSNGKSIIQQLIKKLLTSHNCSNISIQKLEQDQFILNELHNKLVNLGGEISNSSLKEDDKFKSLTTKDMITADRKFLRPINFVSYAKLVFNANQLPKTYDTGFAFFRRWIIIDFIYTFLPQNEYEERKEEHNIKLANTNIIEDITNDIEMSGLLNFALDGLDKLLKNKEFSYSKNTAQIQNIWIRKSDSFSAFMLDCIDEDWESKIKKSDLRKAYADYCKLHKVKGSSDKLIKAHLDNIGVTENRRSYLNDMVSCWEGIKFKREISSNCKDCKDCEGFSPYTEIFKAPIESKNPNNLNSPYSKLDFEVYKKDTSIGIIDNNFVSMDKYIFSKKDFLIDDLYKFCDINEINAIHINDYIEKRLCDGSIIELKKDFYKIV